MVLKRSNALVHFHHRLKQADAFMHNFEIQSLNGYTSATVSNITFSLMPVDSMHFSVHYGIEKLHIVQWSIYALTTQPTIVELFPCKPLKHNYSFGQKHNLGPSITGLHMQLLACSGGVVQW